MNKIIEAIKSFVCTDQWEKGLKVNWVYQDDSKFRALEFRNGFVETTSDSLWKDPDLTLGCTLGDFDSGIEDLMYGFCSTCSGLSYFFETEVTINFLAWVLHPRKGISRPLRWENLQKKDIPAILRWLQEARIRNEKRFSGLDLFLGSP